MDRRRSGGSGAKTRPPTTEALQHWSQTLTSLREVSRLQSQPTPPPETVRKIDKWMSNLPSPASDDSPPSESFENLKMVKQKLIPGLNEIKAGAEAEAKAIADALANLQSLIALRKGPDDKNRIKRARASSPSSLPGSPAARSLSFTGLPQQQSQQQAQPPSHPPPGGISRSASQSQVGGSRSKREWLSPQLPLQPGRKVAFRQPSGGKAGGVGGEGGDGDVETSWILVTVKRCIGNDQKKYEVEDEDQEDRKPGEPGKVYKTTLKNLLPLPDPNAAPDSPSHLNAYDEFPAGRSVLAQYPDTSCFYNAVVVSGPKDPQRVPGQPKNAPVYRLKFEDDDDQIRVVDAHLVVEAPPQ
ncbi:hypothetical protein FS837_009116 [Tulasnella sp. UAMH 9824]|nr:hypothetical protein FS837_009116 [Tulasnella sp. UAMH 9824]